MIDVTEEVNYIETVSNARRTRIMPKTLVNFLLDKSGSMGSCRSATIEAYNAYLAGLKEEDAADIDVTHIQFDSKGFEPAYVAIPVKTAPDLTAETYVPRGGTPLIDATFKMIKAVEEAVARGGINKVVICVQTDGEENASHEHTLEELRELIACRTAEGWQFNFMGAGIDAYAQARAFGINAMATMSYDHIDLAATKDAFVANSANTRAFAAGRSSNTEYSAAQRASSGDRFWSGNLPNVAPAQVAPTGKLDLTQRSAKRPTDAPQTIRDLRL